MITATEISEMISKEIGVWHDFQVSRPADYVIVNKDVKCIRTLNQHRNDIVEVIKELVDTNCEMWHEEDKVRSADDQTVLKAIRNINPLNQHRNDLIEEVDEIVIEEEKEIMETVGSLIDKLSINELKIYHMTEQCDRADVDEVFKEECEFKLNIMKTQRDDLECELQQLLDDVSSGKKKLKVYRQLKMYNEKKYKD